MDIQTGNKKNTFRGIQAGLSACYLFISLLYSVAVHAAPGDQLWAPVPHGGNIGSSVAIDHAAGNLYLGAADHWVRAYDSSGNLIWRYLTGGMVGSTPTISTDNTALYVGAHDGVLYAINTASGAELWRFSTAGVIFSSPALGLDGTIYVGSADGNLYAIDPLTGAERWHYAIGSDVASSPVVAKDGTVYVGARDGILYALDHGENPVSRLKWSYQLSLTEGVFTPSIGGDGTIYVGTLDNTLYALNPAIDPVEREKWFLQLGGKVASAPALGPDGLLYVASYDDGSLHAVDPTIGQLIWTYPTSGTAYSSPAIAADGTVYFTSNGVTNTLYALDPSLYTHTGFTPAQLIKWTSTLDKAVVASPTISTEGHVYISSTASLYALEDATGGLADSDWPMFGLNSRHSASLELPNASPITAPDAVSLGEDDVATDITAILLANDTDPEGSPLVVANIDASTTVGSVLLVNGVVTYNPNGQFNSLVAGATATDQFTYTVDDGDGGSANALVTVTITGRNDAPVAIVDSATVAEGANVVIDLAANVSESSIS